MKYLINGVLMMLASLCLVLFFLLAIDASVANRDYERMVRNGDFEQRVEGCIFDWVCEHYTNELWK